MKQKENFLTLHINNKFLFKKYKVYYLYSLIIFLVFLSLYYLTSPGKTPYDYFLRLANAFLKGKYYLEENPPWLSELIPQGKNKFFVVHPPMPAVLLTPFVLIFKERFEQQYLAHILGALIPVVVFNLALKI
jgi:hypothetical protein